MLGGVTVNVILAMVIYIVMLFTWGEQYLPTHEANKYGISVDSLAMEMGLRNGDKILAVDYHFVEDFQKIPVQMILEEAKTIQVERDQQILDVEIPEGFLSKLVKHRNPAFISIRFPYVVGSFAEISAAKAAGMK